jgi:F-type H+-transporting ATPase subunit epsilon
MQVDIITPESKVFTGEAEAVQFPGLDGSFQVMNNHAPVISGLSEGEVKVNLNDSFSADDSHDLITVDPSDSKTIRVQIKGGVMEMMNNKVIVLAE